MPVLPTYTREELIALFLSRQALRPPLLLDLFAKGTNTGIKRVAKADHQYDYDALLYVRKYHVSCDHSCKAVHDRPPYRRCGMIRLLVSCTAG